MPEKTRPTPVFGFPLAELDDVMVARWHPMTGSRLRQVESPENVERTSTKSLTSNKSTRMSSSMASLVQHGNGTGSLSRFAGQFHFNKLIKSNLQMRRMLLKRQLFSFVWSCHSRFCHPIARYETCSNRISRISIINQWNRINRDLWSSRAHSFAQGRNSSIFVVFEWFLNHWLKSPAV